MLPMEIAACSASTVSVLLAARNNVHTWWTAIIGCVLYGWVFYSVQLYADVSLQLFYIATSVAGWINWLKGHHGGELRVRKTPFSRLALMFLGALIVASGYAMLLRRFTNAWWPWLDSILCVFSVVAQFMIMGRRLESWYLWLMVDTIAIPLYIARELWVTAGLFCIFWCNAWHGLYQWRKAWLATKEQD